MSDREKIKYIGTAVNHTLNPTYAPIITRTMVMALPIIVIFVASLIARLSVIDMSASLHCSPRKWQEQESIQILVYYLA